MNASAHAPDCSPSLSAPNRTPQGLETRARILDAAVRIIVEKGYAALTITSLRAEAKASSASIYHFFENKAAIMTAALAHILQKNAAALATVPRDELNPNGERGVGSLEGAREAHPQTAPGTAFKGFADFIATAKATRGRSTDNPAALLSAMVEGQSKDETLTAAAQRGHGFAADMLAEEWRRYLGGADGAFFAHVHLAFTGYMNQLARCDAPADMQDAAFTSYARALLLGVLSARPDFAIDPQMAAAKSAAERAMRQGGSAE